MLMNTHWEVPKSEFPMRNVIAQPEIEDDASHIMYTGRMYICVPVNTMKSISGFAMANKLKESWQPSEQVIIEETCGCCE